MAKGYYDIELSTVGLCLDLLDKLNSLGFVNSIVGTPSWNTIVFSSLLVPNGYYLRIRANTSYSSLVGIGVDVGTVSGTTFTRVQNIIEVAGIDSGNTRASFKLFYDTTQEWVFITDYHESRIHGAYIGKLDTNERIAFSVCHREARSTGVIFLDKLSTPATGHIITYVDTISLNGNYLEQNLAVKKGTELCMNGQNFAYVVGIKNVACALSTPTIPSTNWFLFGGRYLISSNDINKVLYTYLKIEL